MNKREIKRLNAEAKRRKHGLSKAKIFMQSTERLRELQDKGV